MSVGKMVSFWAQWPPDEVAISFENRNLTWRELDLRAGAFAGTLGNLGVQKGERVGLFMNNRIEFVEVLVACMYTGAICVPLNTRLTESEVATQVSKSSCTVIVTDTDLISRIEQTQQVSPDLNVMDEDGFISVVGRAKDMIISGGYNIYPAEIENILADIDGVLEVAVVGVPDEKWGETPVVFAKSEPSVSISTINQALAGKISRYKIPQYAVLGEIDLPRNISGKVVKAELTRQFLEIEDPSVYSLKQES